MFQTGVWIRSNWISAHYWLVQRREEMAARIYFTSLSGNNCGTETEGIRALFINLKPLIYDKSACTLLNPACDIHVECLVHLCSLY